jgi:ribosomal protein S6--L-glutamate ligase
VITLGVRGQLADYTASERELLRVADIIFFPTDRFFDLFATLGKETFPSANCYRLQGHRLKQTALLRLLDVPHPRTRVYYGHRQKKEILKDFAFPFVAKKPFGSSESGQVFLIPDPEKLDWYNQHFNPAYIQEYLEAEQELRVVVLNYHTLVCYWRKVASDVGKSDSPQTGVWRMDRVPSGVDTLARQIARAAGLSDVEVKIICGDNRYWVLELGFQYGEESWPQAAKDRFNRIMEMIERGKL